MLLLLVLQLLLHRHFGPPSWSLRDAPETRIADPRVFGKPRGPNFELSRPHSGASGELLQPAFQTPGFSENPGVLFSSFRATSGSVSSVAF